MTASPDALPLTLARRVLRALTALNIAYGAGIALMLVASFLFQGTFFRALGVPDAALRDTLADGLRLVMVIGILGVPVAHLMLLCLRAIVDTVREGDPFVVANARRLQLVAWGLAGLELLRLLVGLVGTHYASMLHDHALDWDFSFTPWVGVLLLLVLARVFEHGARMRAELEGTV